MTALSVLDLAPVPEGSDVSQSLQQHARPRPPRRAPRLQALLACRASQHAGHRQRRDLGGDRPCRGGTSTIRVGAGGIMLPNHAPLVIAEQFGTLAALHPGRIDLGLGRAPGTDMATARALRRNLDASVDGFPQDVVELLGYFRPARKTSVCGRCQAKASRSRPGSSGRAPMERSSPRCSDCATLSPRTSRRPRWSMPSTSTGRDSSPPNSSTSRTRCSVSMSSPRRPTRKRDCCSARCSRPSSICAPDGRDVCRRLSKASSKSRSDGEGDAGTGAFAGRRRLA